MAAKDNTVAGKMYFLYMRAKGAPSSDNKLLMCQTDFSISQTANITTTSTKCGEKSTKGSTTRECSVSGSLAMPSSTPMSQDYVDIKQLQTAFDSDNEYSFTLMPEAGSTLSTGKLQVIDFNAKFGSYNQTYPLEGEATFENSLTLDEAPVYTDYVPTT